MLTSATKRGESLQAEAARGRLRELGVRVENLTDQIRVQLTLRKRGEEMLFC